MTYYDKIQSVSKHLAKLSRLLSVAAVAIAEEWMKTTWFLVAKVSEPELLMNLNRNRKLPTVTGAPSLIKMCPLSASNRSSYATQKLWLRLIKAIVL